MYRLTLVKAWNTEEIEGYAELVNLGNPDFIEIKVNCLITFKNFNINLLKICLLLICDFLLIGRYLLRHI